MILIGQYDSPFVRRVAIALTLYDMPFEHRPWSIFSDADKIRPYNPLTRVPTLVLNNGNVLVESHAMLDYLDHHVGPERAMFPPNEPARHLALHVAALASGMADKAVALFYERRMHAQVSLDWVNRCQSQIQAVMSALETDRATRPGRYWFGDRIGHADIMVACALQFLAEVHTGLVDLSNYPALTAHAKTLEMSAEFRKIAQPFVPPV